MKLDQYLTENEISNEQFADDIGTSTEAVRLYRLDRRIPGREIMTKITTETGGAVQANDFYAVTTQPPNSSTE